MAQGGARSWGRDRTGIPEGVRTRMLQRRRVHRVAGVPQREDHELGNGCGTSPGMAAGVRDNCGLRTPETPIWTYQAGLKCPIKSS